MRRQNGRFVIQRVKEQADLYALWLFLSFYENVILYVNGKKMVGKNEHLPKKMTVRWRRE